MKLNQLRALAEVAKAGSIQRAAQAMNLSQPALSKSIRELERQLGVPLLVRSVNGTCLTPFGAVLSKRFDGIEKEMQKAREEIDWLKGALGGRLLLGMSPPVGGTNIARILTAFRQRQPSVELELLELRPGQIFDAVRSGILDFGLVHHYGHMDLAGLQYVTLKSYPTILAIGGPSPSIPQSVDELWDREWITGDLADHPDGYIAVLSRLLGLDIPRHILRCTSISVYFELAGQAQIISHWADNISVYLDMKFASGALTRLDLDLNLPEMKIAMVYKDEELLSPSAARLAKSIGSSLE